MLAHMCILSLLLLITSHISILLSNEWANNNRAVNFSISLGVPSLSCRAEPASPHIQFREPEHQVGVDLHCHVVSFQVYASIAALHIHSWEYADYSFFLGQRMRIRTQNDGACIVVHSPPPPPA